MPKRIQRKRTKGWRMPENTVYVGRGSKWGNRFKVGWTCSTPYEFRTVKDDIEACSLYNSYCISYEPANSGLVKKTNAFVGRHPIKELKGKNLACWCKEGEPCHADILLKLANEEAI